MADFAGLEGCATGCVTTTVVTGREIAVESAESVQALRTPSAIKATALEISVFEVSVFEVSVFEVSVFWVVVGNACDAKFGNFIGASGGRLTDSSST